MTIKQLASMGPRHLSRGISKPHSTIIFRPCRFNGATASEPWNPTQPVGLTVFLESFNGATASEPWNLLQRRPRGHSNIPLQWGHGI